MFKYHPDGTQPFDNEIFVFGSNLAGIHGAGAARAAYDKYGAKWGQGLGFAGQSFAIPTKDVQINTLKFDIIKNHVNIFAKVTDRFPEQLFFITRIGCGLAGLTDEQMAPLFKNCNKENCNMPINWQLYFEI